MTPYLVISGIVIFASFFDITNLYNNKGLYYLLFLILVVFIGTRDNIGTDWWVYEKIFNDKGSAELVEPGYRLLQFCVKLLFGNNYYAMVFNVALVSLLIKFRAFEKIAPLSFVAVLYYFGYYYIPQEANQIRQGLAAGILIFAIPYLADGNIKKFVGIVFVATLFHFTALVFLPCIWIRKLKGLKISAIFLIVLAFSSFMFIDMMFLFEIIISKIIVKVIPIPLATDKLLSYVTSRYAEVQGFYLGSLFLLFFIFLFGIYRKKIQSNTYDVFYICFVFGVCLNFFFNSFAVLGRLTFHFILLGAILYSYVVKFEKRIFFRVIYILVLSLISVSKLNNYVTSEKASHKYLPYKSTFISW